MSVGSQYVATRMGMKPSITRPVSPTGVKETPADQKTNGTADDQGEDKKA